MKTRTVGRSTTTRSRRSPHHARAGQVARMAPPVELTWSYLGTGHRVTVWPDVRMERQEGDGWAGVAATEDVLAAGMLQVMPAAWRRYLEFMPAGERAFLEKFRYGRLAALLMLARCPQLLADLDETPALVPFLAAHASLRGTAGPRWDEITAIHENGGVFGLLEWLGLPAARPTFSVLRNLMDPDVPRRLLEPLRALLWRPSASFVLERTAMLTDRDLARYCHALAA